MAQIPEIYRDDLKEIISETFQGRYGAEGSKAVFQWIQEENPQVDSSLYKNIQVTIEAGRNEFTVAQTQLLDVKRSYETNLGYLWKGFWLKIAGYPKLDLSKYKPVVATDTAEKFNTGIDYGIQLRKPKSVEK